MGASIGYAQRQPFLIAGHEAMSNAALPMANVCFCFKSNKIKRNIANIFTKDISKIYLFIKLSFRVTIKLNLSLATLL